MNAELVALTRAVGEEVAAIRRGIRQALPGNTGLHSEFGVDEALPAEPAALARVGLTLEPLAREYRSLLLSRGIDAARLKLFAERVATLARLAPEPAAEPAPPKGTRRGGPVRKRAKRS